MKFRDLLICLFLGCDGLSNARKEDWKSLYPKGKSSVEEIDPDELKNIVAMKETTATMVEFYAPWCPHCQHFSSKYEAVGEHFTGNSAIRITAMDCVRYRDTCSDYKVKGYPSIHVFGVSSEPTSYDEFGYTLKLTGKETPTSLIEWMNKNTNIEVIDKEIKNKDASLSLHEPLQPSKLMHSGERWSLEYTSANQVPARLRLGDAASSLMFALRYGVFVDGDTLKSEQRLALGTFLSILAKSFPGPSSDRQAITQLLALVDSGDLTQNVEWESFLSKWQLQGRLATDEMRWSNLCDPSRRQKKNSGSGRHISGGYTCGLWTMFHMLLMTAPQAGLSTNEITGAIRIFVDHFFGCENCRLHFLSMFDSCGYGRCDSSLIDNAQLWLWKTHNAVNVRVAFEALKDEAARGKENVNEGVGSEDKVIDLDPAWALWPTTVDCPQCRLPSSEHGIVEWDEKEVIQYLKRAYDVGLWEENKVTGLVRDAEQSKQSITTNIDSLLSRIMVQKELLFGLLFALVIFAWFRQRRKLLTGAHKKVRSRDNFKSLMMGS